MKELEKAHYYLEHVYLNWGRAKEMDVKEDFAKGFNIIASLLNEQKIQATETGWKVSPTTK